jgi:signal peptidase I
VADAAPRPAPEHGGPQEGGDLVKRVIALPGQTIYSSGNSIYIDGRRLAEPYVPHYDPLGPPIPGASRQHPYRVPPGEYDVLDDNRADSCDSRYWEPIKGSSIIGKVMGDVLARQPPRLPPVLIPTALTAAPAERSARPCLHGP